jgi:hypothetical protein
MTTPWTPTEGMKRADSVLTQIQREAEEAGVGVHSAMMQARMFELLAAEFNTLIASLVAAQAEVLTYAPLVPAAPTPFATAYVTTGDDGKPHAFINGKEVAQEPDAAREPAMASDDVARSMQELAKEQFASKPSGKKRGPKPKKAKAQRKARTPRAPEAPAAEAAPEPTAPGAASEPAAEATTPMGEMAA